MRTVRQNCRQVLMSTSQNQSAAIPLQCWGSSKTSSKKTNSIFLTSRLASRTMRAVSRSHHGRSAKQEIAFQAWHASFARFFDHAAHGNRAHHGRTASASPHFAQRLLPRPQGPQDQERRVI